jgi:hypothetical protein
LKVFKEVFSPGRNKNLEKFSAGEISYNNELESYKMEKTD